MISVLQTILCWIEAIANMVLWALMTMINTIISGIAAAVGGVLSLLPDMPSAPSWTGVTSEVFGYANWAFPVGFLVAAVASLALLWLGWQGVAWVLRMARAAG